jgi:hypothetical protein
MNPQPGVTSPDSYPIRDPRDSGMKSGRVMNPPHFQTLGGLTGQGKWPEGSDFPVEGPTRTSVAKKSSEKSI